MPMRRDTAVTAADVVRLSREAGLTAELCQVAGAQEAGEHVVEDLAGFLAAFAQGGTPVWTGYLWLRPLLQRACAEELQRQASRSCQGAGWLHAANGTAESTRLVEQ